MMKKELLQLEDGKSLTVKKRIVAGADFRFDFDNKKLTATENDKRDKVSNYIISKELADAVNAAIITGRPLLLKGEPGCGKTKLGKAVAAYFFGDELAKYYFEWHVKSRSNAREGAYHFDHVSRLRDATITDKDGEDNIKAKDPTNYIRLGAMGMAFKCETPEGKFPILLIDEIDKGDIDFPNDLLLELDEMRFAINELEQKDKYISADESNRPLVIITSNNERELPPAFLRRCLYYKIPPFKSDLLGIIAGFKAKEFYEDLYKGEADKKNLTEEEVKVVVSKFIEVKKSAAATKPPSTSELLDWLKVILYQVNAQGKTVEDVIKDDQLRRLTLKLMN